MKALFLGPACLLIALPCAAQSFPVPSQESPRIQEARWQEGQSLTLTVLPESHLTVLLEPGQVIQRATISDGKNWDVSISIDQDGFTVLPARGARNAVLTIDTLDRTYQFTLETAQTLLAAYIVRFIPTEQSAEKIAPPELNPDAQKFAYRVKGDKAVRPLDIADDGRITVIDYAPGQSLPAVFAIGPSGNEEVVDGYMRAGRFVIDRVHRELVFRIDKKKATARRNKKAQEQK